MWSSLLLASLWAVTSQGARLPPVRKTSNVQAPLQFTSNGTFQISIFEDLHFGENAWDQWGHAQDQNTVNVINEILDAETSQQLVVLNGDLITGENQYKFNGTHYFDEIAAPLVQRGLTWASTYGNHDSAYNLSREGIYQREHRYANTRTANMVSNASAGVTNYYLPVYSSSGGSVPALLLWFFDSRGGEYFQELTSTVATVGQPDWVDQSVVNWFTQTNAQLTQQYGKQLPSLAFVHIPTNASQAFQTGVKVNPNTQPGVNDDYILAQQAQGWCPDGADNDSCAYGGQDVPFMKAITSTPGLMAIFSGHDHGDTWCYRWNTVLPGMTIKGNGINICFGQHTGYGGYGNWIRGSRQVLVTEELLKTQAVRTWIRLENASVVGSVVLNSTYNHNVYPATPDTMTYCPTCNYSIITPMPGTEFKAGEYEYLARKRDKGVIFSTNGSD